MGPKAFPDVDMQPFSAYDCARIWIDQSNSMEDMSMPNEQPGHKVEDEFFHKREEELIARLRQKQMREKIIEDLKATSGIGDVGVLEKLIELGITPATMSVFALVHLVHAAWAGGRVDQKKREATLAAARQSGIETGSEQYNLLERWLERIPEHHLFVAWQEYIRAVCKEKSKEEVEILKAQILGQAHTVVRASRRTIRSVFTISSDHRKVLTLLEKTFENRLS